MENYSVRVQKAPSREKESRGEREGGSRPLRSLPEIVNSEYSGEQRPSLRFYGVKFPARVVEGGRWGDPLCAFPPRQSHRIRDEFIRKRCTPGCKRALPLAPVNTHDYDKSQWKANYVFEVTSASVNGFK